MVQAGWYDDPQQQGQLRYWDGGVWTEHTAPRPDPSGPGTLAPARADDEVPWSLGSERSLADEQPGYGDFEDVGGWIVRTFKVFTFNPFGIIMLGLVVPLIPVLTGAATMYSLSDAIVSVDGDLDRFDTSRLTTIGALAAVTVVGFIVAMCAYLGLHHLLYWAHRGVRSTWSGSLVRGIRRLPRFLGIGLLLMVAFVAFFAVFALLVVAVPDLAILFFVLLVLGMIPLGIVVGVKLAFLPTTVAVVPRGTSALSSSTAVSAGRFWGVFGRLLLLYLIVIAVSMAFTTVAGLFFDLSQFQFDDPEAFQADGSTFDWTDFAPSVGAFTGYLLVSMIGSLFQYMLLASGTSAMYGDRNGPADIRPDLR